MEVRHSKLILPFQAPSLNDHLEREPLKESRPAPPELI